MKIEIPREIERIGLVEIYGLQKISSEGDEIWRKTWEDDSTKPRKPQDLIRTSDNGYLLFCFTGDNPFWYATLIKTDSEGNEQWRKHI